MPLLHYDAGASGKGKDHEPFTPVSLRSARSAVTNLICNLLTNKLEQGVSLQNNFTSVFHSNELDFSVCTTKYMFQQFLH